MKQISERNKLCIELLVVTANLAKNCHKVEEIASKMHEELSHMQLEELKVQRRYLTMMLANIETYTTLAIKRTK